MKRILSCLLLGTICFFQTACKKELESIINCTGEGLLMSVNHAADAGSAKLIHFEAQYSGSHTLESVSWEFGDGTTGTGAKVDHTYAAAGTYQVKAKIKIKSGKSTCESDPVRSVVVN